MHLRSCFEHLSKVSIVSITRIRTIAAKWSQFWAHQQVVFEMDWAWAAKQCNESEVSVNQGLSMTSHFIGCLCRPDFAWLSCSLVDAEWIENWYDRKNKFPKSPKLKQNGWKNYFLLSSLLNKSIVVRSGWIVDIPRNQELQGVHVNEVYLPSLQIFAIPCVRIYSNR